MQLFRSFQNKHIKLSLPSGSMEMRLNLKSTSLGNIPYGLENPVLQGGLEYQALLPLLPA